MKNALVAVLALFIMASPAAAEESWFPPFLNKEKPVKVPTGYEVKGCKDYYIKNGKVYPVCEREFGSRWWWFLALPHGG